MSLDWLRKRFSFKSGVTAREGLPAPPKAELEPVRSPREVAYRRPRFLAAVAWKGEGTEVDSRPIYSSPQDHPLLWSSGYAEVINSCKSQFNEDQAVCCHISAKRKESCQWEEAKLLVSPDGYVTSYYWALFDGHGGPAAAMLASNYLHCCIKQNLEHILEGLMGTHPPMHLSRRCIYQSDPQFVEEKGICHDHLVIGALENAFQDCDEMICQEMLTTKQSGGCTALTALYLHGKFYLANAGDSRAIIIQKQSIMQLSSEFTPEMERQRLQYLARLLGTLAVSRGLGDHQLKVAETNIAVKPFLSCIPEVKVLDFANHEFLKDDVLVMATDGLWDVLSNEEVAQVVRCFLDENKLNPCRFLDLAKHLVCKARGTKTGNQWTLDSNTPASYDDISVFVIPLWCQNSLPEP
ncbi:protein phosphatase 1M isoform X2 [Rhinatrema bivittatum]|uniref:protein phosphatase 1M isoform X2 n=1 Tax=Rhinatrema bivittatum TaxID=194408 RepID=UPI00112EF799|nr:protein phosphatase 1M isoform X2 [Rhinatrema bivittatum]